MGWTGLTLLMQTPTTCTHRWVSHGFSTKRLLTSEATVSPRSWVVPTFRAKRSAVPSARGAWKMTGDRSHWLCALNFLFSFLLLAWQIERPKGNKAGCPIFWIGIGLNFKLYGKLSWILHPYYILPSWLGARTILLPQTFPSRLMGSSRHQKKQRQIFFTTLLCSIKFGTKTQLNKKRSLNDCHWLFTSPVNEVMSPAATNGDSCLKCDRSGIFWFGRTVICVCFGSWCSGQHEMTSSRGLKHLISWWNTSTKPCNIFYRQIPFSGVFSPPIRQSTSRKKCKACR